LRWEYEDNLKYLVEDVLTEFGSDTPFLIGEVGQRGENGGGVEAILAPTVEKLTSIAKLDLVQLQIL
jgi:hypothetical protein